jgi:hypothetical protein
VKGGEGRGGVSGGYVAPCILPRYGHKNVGAGIHIIGLLVYDWLVGRHTQV